MTEPTPSELSTAADMAEVEEGRRTIAPELVQAFRDALARDEEAMLGAEASVAVHGAEDEECVVCGTVGPLFRPCARCGAPAVEPPPPDDRDSTIAALRAELATLIAERNAMARDLDEATAVMEGLRRTNEEWKESRERLEHQYASLAADHDQAADRLVAERALTEKLQSDVAALAKEAVQLQGRVYAADLKAARAEALHRRALARIRTLSAKGKKTKRTKGGRT